MSLTPFAVRVVSADDLILRLNLALAPLTSALISSLEIGQMRNDPPNARNLFAAFSSDPTGATPLPQPFQVIAFSASSESQVTTLLQQFITAHPTYFFSGPYMIYRPTNPDPNTAVIGVLAFNSAGSIAAFNWIGNGSGNSLSGKPTQENADRSLGASDNGDSLICTGSLTFTVPAGLPIGFGVAAKGTCLFTPGAGVTVNDVRVSGSLNPWCALLQTNTDAYDVVGGVI